MTNISDPQQSGKKGKDKSKDMVALVEQRLVEIRNTISALIGRIDDMDKCIEELEVEGDMKELRGRWKGC